MKEEQYEEIKARIMAIEARLNAIEIKLYNLPYSNGWDNDCGCPPGYECQRTACPRRYSTTLTW